MKINKLLLIVVALVLSFVMLTACSGETTQDATQNPESTPTPSAEKTNSDKALTFYEMYQGFSLDSYISAGHIVVGLETDEGYVEKNYELKTTAINDPDNYVRYIVVKDEEDNVIKEAGFINGYEFSRNLYSGNETLYKTLISAEEYSKKYSCEELKEALRPTKEKCEDIGAVWRLGPWKIQFKNYDLENSKKIYNEILDLIGIEIEYELNNYIVSYDIDMSEDGQVYCRTMYILAKNTETQKVFFFYYHDSYEEKNTVDKAPEIDLSQYEEITLEN